MTPSRLNHKILAIALPAIVTNITTPLLGLMDVAITGHLGRPEYIAAIAVGGNIFNIIYWIFSFLRSATSGITAQAYGAGDTQLSTATLWRSALIGVLAGLLLIALSVPLVGGFISWMEVTGDTAAYARRYFLILVWGAPAFLATYAITGWLIGRQDSRSAMWISLIINVVNILVSLLLVYLAGLRIEGVAFGTLTAQWAGVIAGVIFIAVRHRRPRLPLDALFDARQLRRFFSISSDLFLRTLCLVAVTVWFTRVGASQGTLVLAANTILMQFFLFFSYFSDGFAYAGEALCGRYIGAADVGAFSATVGRLLMWGGAIALLFIAVYGLGGTLILDLLSDDSGVRATAREYLPWLVALPALGFMSFIYDGVFVGATRSRFLLGSMAVATAVYFALYAVLFSRLGNHGLWIAFLAYLLVRGLFLLWADHRTLRPSLGADAGASKKVAP